ncbi:MAG: transporter substrate-binding domain-containing protein [Spirochaetales bacterium]|nr:transporter substrate-binding domain-containing protein [Spirochaetales bacterium]
MKYVKPSVSLFFLLTLIFITSFSARQLSSQDRASESEPSRLHIRLTEKEQQWLDKHKTIRIGGPKSFPPFHAYTEKGMSEGIASDYVDLILSSLDVEVISVPDLPWPEVLKRTRDKELDLIACSGKSPDREEYLLFTEPHLSFPLIIITREDAPFISGLQDLTDRKVALLPQNIISDWLETDGIEVIPFSADSPLKALEAVSTGAAEAYIGNLAATSYLISEYGLVNLKVAAPTEYGNYNLYMAVREDWPELVSILNKGLEAISVEQHRVIRNNWLSIKYEYGISPRDIIRTVVIVGAAAAVILLIILRWNRLLRQEIENRKKTETELKAAFEDIKTLNGLLPICSHCKNIRDDKGYWNKLEAYLEEHTDASFSHSLCPRCARELYGNEEWFTADRKENEKKE